MSTFDLFTELIPDAFSDNITNPLARLGVEAAIIDDMSQRQTMREFRNLGFSFGDRAFRRLWYEVTNFSGQFSYPSKLNLLTLPDPNIMSFSNFDITAKYGYVGGIPIYDPKSDRVTYRTFRVDSDQLLTGAEALDALYELILKYEDLQDYTVNDIEYLGAFRDSNLWEIEE